MKLIEYEQLKRFLSKLRTEFTNSINSAIAIINKYTINGHLIKDNPALTNADVGLGNVINTAKTGLVTVGTNSTVYITIKYNNYQQYFTLTGTLTTRLRTI